MSTFKEYNIKMYYIMRILILNLKIVFYFEFIVIIISFVQNNRSPLLEECVCVCVCVCV